MTDLSVKPTDRDFSGVHAAMQKYVDADIVSGMSAAVLQGRDLVAVHTVGHAEKEGATPLRTDHLFRAFSNTKLVTSIAVMQLWERGLIDLDEPVARHLPQLADRRVLRPGATSLADAEPAKTPITTRQLLSHSAGLAYGLLDPGSLLFNAYAGAKVMNPATPLEDMMNALAPLPLAYEPGTSWEYSVATDVLGRLVEVLSGQRLGDYFRVHVFEPLGMRDTAFSVPPADHARLTALYAGAELTNPMKGGLTPIDGAFPWPGAYLAPVPRQSGGGGLVSTLPDMVALVRGLLPDGPTVLKPETIALMMRNQLPEGVTIRFPGIGPVPNKGFGLGGAVTLAPSSIDPPDSTGEFQWGGIAGTHWWISPRHNVAGLLMTQRQMSFWHPFSFEVKRAMWRALGLG